MKLFLRHFGISLGLMVYIFGNGFILLIDLLILISIMYIVIVSGQKELKDVIDPMEVDKSNSPLRD